jgi:hypothetical protein
MLRSDARKELEQVCLQGLREYYSRIEHINGVGDKFDQFYCDQTISLRDCFSASIQMNFLAVENPLLNARAFELATSLPGKLRRKEGIHKYIIHNSTPELEKFWLDYSSYPAPYLGFEATRLIPLGIERVIRKIDRWLPMFRHVSLRRSPISPDQVLRPGLAKARDFLLSSHPLYDSLTDRANVEKTLGEFERSGQHAQEIIQLLTFRMFLDLL